MKLLICGGGTGGHIYPALSVVASLQQQGLEASDFLWIGTRNEIEERLVPTYGLRLETIVGGAIAGVSWPTRLANAAKLTWSLGKVNGILRNFSPDALLMTGGYVNVPVALTAWLRRIPAAIFLPDIEPGLAIRWLSRLASLVACTAEESAVYFRAGKTVTTGYPVRPELRKSSAMSREEALARFDLTPGRPTLFVFGGSRGARSINRALMTSLDDLLNTIQVIHVSGELDWQEVRANSLALGAGPLAYYRVYPYLHEEMGAAFRAADLVLARAGASMLGECPAFGIPAVLVPYPHAWRYQKVNAEYLVARGAAVRIEDETLAETFLPTVLELIEDADKLKSMSAAAKTLDVPDSAANLAQLMLDLGRGTIT